jgi:hypothetical protein
LLGPETAACTVCELISLLSTAAPRTASATAMLVNKNGHARTKLVGEMALLPYELCRTLAFRELNSQRAVRRVGYRSARLPARIFREEAAVGEANLINEIKAEDEADQSGCNPKSPVDAWQVACSVRKGH